MRSLLVIFLMLGMVFPASAQKNKNARHQVEVNGNCGQCKKRIEKAALSVEGVKMAQWEEGTKMLSLVINEEKTSVEAVEKAIAKVGHDTRNSKASEQDYENLHHCCKYER